MKLDPPSKFYGKGTTEQRRATRTGNVIDHYNQSGSRIETQTFKTNAAARRAINGLK